MADTVVTFIVPAYNSSATLRKCLDSLVLDTNAHDVLVVNDGSTDNTAEIAQEYVSKYDYIRLVNKENGGHGSVINYGTAVATGKYFKVLDSDDWIQTGNLPFFIESLRNSAADVVVTNFRTIDSRNNLTREYAMSGVEFGREYSFDDIWQHKKTIAKVFAFHGITYNTEFYQRCRVSLSEGISYEDQEYATLPFANVKTVLPLDFYLYEYSLGDPNQSVSDEKQIKNLSHLEIVLWRVVDEKPAGLSANVNDYFLHKQNEVLFSYYIATLIKSKNKTEGRKLASAMRQCVQAREAKLLKASRMQYRLCVTLSYLGVTSSTKAKAERLGIYQLLARMAR